MSNLYSIGYQGRTIEQFIALLRKYNVNVIVECRAIPYSKYNEAFNWDNLKKHSEFVYVNDVSLGNDGYFNYKDIDYIISKPYNGYAFMCMETDPTKCHRSTMIGKYLLNNIGIDVQHITTNGSILKQSEINLLF